ncbi:unnamed protein product (macronuclear) [Paramecium tetraurelia]|uniref:Uncharacterized protein n=1 Tax=Paramecium tetraurelia TaxID=5888 RepID=A0DVL7_PARTE|nr:uncharacterized protein GSPATT00020737001 [Paramecium tetraurelia]CAK87084.1 unnamed protein product [Paramecium tetraurelia]|eukprot:XP_001454481.1 hypothetical protein (macronuclear) [Paramecium tetraurelia strain d4-2]
MYQRKRVKTVLDYNKIERDLPKCELSEQEKSIVGQAIRERKFNLRTRIKSVNSKAELCKNYREYEDKMKLSIAQIVDYEYKQSKQSVSTVKHKGQFTTIFSIQKPKYDPSIVYGSQNNRRVVQIKEILRKL